MPFTLSSLQAGSYQGNKGDKGDPGEKGIDGTIGVNGDKGQKGEVGSVGLHDVTLDTFTGDGSTTAFNLSTQPLDENHTVIVIEGVTQLKSTYSLSGNTVTFSEAPANGYAIDVTTILGGAKGDKGEAGPVNLFDVISDSFTGDGSNTVFTLTSTPLNEGHTIVTVGGVVQLKAAYTVSGANVVLSEAPANGVGIDIVTFKGGAKGDKGSAGDVEAQGNKGDKGETGTVDVSSITNTTILFADGANVNGSAAFTFNKASNTITVGGSIIPNANVAYDLGTTNLRFKDLYLSGNTIDLGGTTISSNGTAITLPELVLQPVGSNTPVSISVSNGVLSTTVDGQTTTVNTPRYITVVQTGEITSPLTSNTRYYPPVDINLVKVHAHVGTAPASNFSFQLKKNGTSIGTFTIASGQYVLTPNTIAVALNTTDYLTMAVTSGTSSELHVDIEYLIV
jgi:hypothetical protein